MKTFQKPMVRHYLKEIERQSFNVPETLAMATFLRVEAPNIRQCFQWALELKDLDLLCECIHRFEQVVRGVDDIQIIRKLAKTAIEVAKHNPHQKDKIVFYWRPFFNVGFVTDVMMFLEASLVQAQKDENAESIVFCLLAMSDLQRLLGNLNDASEYLKQLESLGFVKNRSPQHACLLYRHSLISWERSEFSEAERLLRQSIDLWKELGVATEFIGLQEMLVTLLEEKGDLERAACLHEEVINYIRQGISLQPSDEVMQYIPLEASRLQKIRWKHYLCGYLHGQALRYLSLNRPKSAETLLRESIYWGREMDLSFHLIWALNDLAVEILCPRGEFQEAHSLLKESIALAKSTGHRRIYGALLNSKAFLLLAEIKFGFRSKDALNEVRHSANQSWRIAQELNHDFDKGNALLVLGQLKIHDCSFVEAEVQLLDALAVFKKKNKPLSMARCLLALGNLNRQKGRWDEAETCYHQAQSYAERLDIRCEILHNWALMNETQRKYDAAQSKWQEVLPTCRAWNLILGEEVEILLRKSAQNQGFAVYLLGSLRLKYNGKDISLDKIRPHSREHLAYLAFHAGKRRFNDQIFDDLWEKSHPSMTPYDESFKRNLRQVVYVVRRKTASVCGNTQAKQLLPNATEGSYCFDPDDIAWVDWREFERALDDADQAVQEGNWIDAFKLWEFADELYSGELLADWRYADWTYGQPSRIHDRWLNSLQRWGNAHLNRGEYYQGLQVAKRMLDLEPTSEPARRLEMECLEQLTRKD